jgi:membrane fusion protein, heavy metal efflux system
MNRPILQNVLGSLAAAAVLALAGCSGGEADGQGAAAQTGDEHGEGEAGHEEAGGERVVIPAAAAQASGLVISAAGPGALRETLSLPGRLMLQPSARAEIHAPYPGPVRAVLRDIGDNVRRGETLARVESAESLQVYAIAAPISGVVLERQTNIGDVTSEAPLFIVGDVTRLNAELNVSTRDIGRVAPGQIVIVTGLDGATRVEARIASVLPAADAHSQTLIARAPVQVTPTSPIRPGMAVRGEVVLAEREVAIAVPIEAVQTLEGRQVVFVQVEPDTYEARPVSTGASGGGLIEITAGLSAGERYVSENAFLVKAEIGKGAASHDH